MLLEHAAEMALIGEPGLGSDLAQRCLGHS